LKRVAVEAFGVIVEAVRPAVILVFFLLCLIELQPPIEGGFGIEGSSSTYRTLAFLSKMIWYWALTKLYYLLVSMTLPLEMI
jgi:hypothetical protein